MIFTIIILLAFFCWIAALLFLRQPGTGYFRHMIWFMAAATVTELFGYLVYFRFHQKNNYWVFNTFLPVEIFFLSWFLYKILIHYYNCKPWIIAGLTLFCCFYFYESIRDGFVGISMNAKKFASVYLILLCLSYYYHLQKKEEYIRLKSHPPFWIMTGCFFFYFGSVACDFFFDYLLAINTVSLKPVRYVIFIVLNFILYGCWTYAFLCKYKQTILSS